MVKKRTSNLPNVLVTGGAGFVGSHLVEKMVDIGYHVTVVDDLSNGRLSNLERVRSNPNFKFVKVDFRDKSVTGILHETNLVFHLAAITSVPLSVRDPLGTFETNTMGTFRLLQLCAGHKVKRVVLASSAAVYGDQSPPLKEVMSARPLSPYAASKVAGEAFLSAFHSVFGMETVCLRLMNVYGPRSWGTEAGVVEKFIRSIEEGSPLVIRGTGSQTRDFVHVLDVVEALVAAGSSLQANGETINVGTGVPTTVNDLASLLEGLSGHKLKVLHEAPSPGDVPRSYADITKAKSLLGYRPKVSLKVGLKSTLNQRSSKGRN